MLTNLGGLKIGSKLNLDNINSFLIAFYRKPSDPLSPQELTASSVKGHYN